jgi:hypothetical protein
MFSGATSFVETPTRSNTWPSVRKTTRALERSRPVGGQRGLLRLLGFPDRECSVEPRQHRFIPAFEFVGRVCGFLVGQFARAPALFEAEPLVLEPLVWIEVVGHVTASS